MTSIESRESGPKILRQNKRSIKRKIFIEKLKYWWTLQHNETKTGQERDVMEKAEFENLFGKFSLSYEERVQTFVSRAWSKEISVSKLAECGFCFTGDDDIVVCFSCKGKVKGWESGDEPLKRHLKIYPRCEFARSLSKKTRYKVTFDSPLTEGKESSASSEEDEMEVYFKSEFNRLMSFRKCSFSNFVDPYELAASGLYYLGDWSENVSTEERQQISHHLCLSVNDEEKISLTDEEKIQAEFFFPHIDTESTDDCEVDSGSKIRKLGSALLSVDKPPVNDKFKSEYQRRLTYYGWPLRSIVDPSDLASAGFYWNRYDPSVTVKCFACFGEIAEWRIGEKPHRKHGKLYPSCPFINNLETGNKKLTEAEKGKVVSQFRQRDEKRSHLIMQHKTILDEEVSQTDSSKSEVPNRKDDFLPQKAFFEEITGKYKSENSEGIAYSEKESSLNGTGNPAKYPQFLEEECRLDSFVTWPSNHCQKPEDLATAGFFYQGTKDVVACFHCGGKLVDWEKNDKPWEEHARNYPDCGWLLQQKGRKFINDTQLKNFRQDTPQHQREDCSYDSGQNPSNAVRNTTLPDRTGPLPSGSSLSEELEKLKERSLCKICLDDDVEILFLPCKHLVVCQVCAERMETCPICRRFPEEKVRIFIL